MSKKKILLKGLILTGLFMLSVSTACAEPCKADANCDGRVSVWDYILFKQEFGRKCDPCITAPVPKTGQTTCYDTDGNVIDCAGTGQDGEYQKGVAWPNPRFTDNGDGTVTDNLTGLIWLEDANCFGERTWSQALSDCNGLASGDCGLTDGSSAGQWRLPNRFELESLLHLGFYNPAVPNTAGTGKWTEGDPFTNVQYLYWSSTTGATNASYAWYVSMYNGYMHYYYKSNHDYVWPVRGGQ